jgi:1-pyrroline-5-carboxylate dehydrogenase
MKQALANTKSKLGQEYGIIIGHRELRTSRTFSSINPSQPSQVVGHVHDAGPEHVSLAIKAATRAFVKWKSTSIEKRISILKTIAKLLRKRKYEFCAWLVYEIGKNWEEADSEVAEAIDFAEFYALQAETLVETETAVQLPGEKNSLLRIPLGVGAVIAPWNFPCAIVAGMIMAPIVAGNTVILKPSPNAPVIAAKFMEVLLDAGVPAGVVNFCPSSSSAIGPALVEHPEIRFIVFTGSKEAGLDINLRAAMPRPGQKWIKRTILEMGGKDAIVIDEDAYLESAVDGVVQSAFGFSGQKCSACSRAIVDAKVHHQFLTHLRYRLSELTVGDPEENAFVGPVVSERQFNRVLEYINLGKKEGRIVVGGHALPRRGQGYFIEPTVIADVAPTARIAQEEIFGPVLAVIKSRSFRHSLGIANNTEFGLTGAVYTKSREKLNLARDTFHVGNLYFNRKCTGAMVGAHPFGGFNMSGTNSKAGGPDYVLLFTQAKSVAEKAI